MQKSKLKIKVSKNYIDEYNHVNFADYLRFCQLGHENYLSEIGVGKLKEMESKYGVRTFVRKAEIEYLDEIKEGDTINIITHVERVGSTSITYSQNIKKSNKIIFTSRIVFVFVDKKGKPTNVPKKIVDDNLI